MGSGICGLQQGLAKVRAVVAGVPEMWAVLGSRWRLCGRSRPWSNLIWRQRIYWIGHSAKVLGLMNEERKS